MNVQATTCRAIVEEGAKVHFSLKKRLNTEGVSERIKNSFRKI